MSYVIRYAGSGGVSYYAGPSAIGPRFGATLETAVRFESHARAEAALDAFPWAAMMSCTVEHVAADEGGAR